MESSEVFWKLVDFAWVAVLAVVTLMHRNISRWNDALERHERRLAVIEKELKMRDEADRQIMADLAGLNARVDAQRIESADRMERLRSEIREDYRMLVEMISKIRG